MPGRCVFVTPLGVARYRSCAGNRKLLERSEFPVIVMKKPRTEHVIAKSRPTSLVWHPPVLPASHAGAFSFIAM